MLLFLFYAVEVNALSLNNVFASPVITIPIFEWQGTPVMYVLCNATHCSNLSNITIATIIVHVTPYPWHTSDDKFHGLCKHISLYHGLGDLQGNCVPYNPIELLLIWGELKFEFNLHIYCSTTNVRNDNCIYVLGNYALNLNTYKQSTLLKFNPEMKPITQLQGQDH